MKGPLGRAARTGALFALGVLPSALAHAQTWHRVSSPDFVVLSDAGEDKAREVAREFEEIREVFRTALPSMRSDPTRPIERVCVHFATEPSEISLTEDGQATLEDIYCGSSSYVVEATYSPASRSPSGTDVDGELAALGFPPNQ